MSVKLKLLYAIFLTAIFPFGINAQTFPYTHYTAKNGLSSSNVYCISQDKDGYMWFGTESGISRFDGLEFVNYSNPQFGLTSFISSIWPFNTDSLLVGTNLEGVKMLNLTTGKSTRFYSSGNQICNQILYTDSVITALSEYHGIDFYFRKPSANTNPDPLVESDGANLPVCILKDSKGEIIIGRTAGLFQLINGVQKRLEISGMIDQPVYSIVEKKNGNWLLGTGHSILETDGKKIISTIPISIVADQKVSNLKVDIEGNIWFSFRDNSDIYLLRKGQITDVSKAIGTFKGIITDIFPDKDGNIWVSLIGKGVYLFSNASIFNYLEHQLLTYSDILSIQQSGDSLAIGTHDGLLFKNTNSPATKMLKSFGAMEEYSREVQFPTPKEVYVTLTDRRIFSGNGSFFPYLKKNGINYYHGSSLFIDSTKILLGNWDDKIYFFDRTRPGELLDSIFDISKTRNNNRVNSICKDAKGAIWAGTQKGLFCFSQNRKVFAPIHDLLKTSIQQVYSLNNDQVLVCSSKGFGVYNFHDDEVNVVKEHVFPMLNCVYYEDEKHIYLGTQNGLVCLINSDTVVIGQNDGLPSNHINCLHFDAARNLLMVGTPEGFSEINLQEYLSKHISGKQVFITSLNNGLGIYDTIDRYNLNYSANSIHIKFSVFNYDNPAALKFQYRHNDDHWIDTKSRELEFAALNPGEHNIRIRAGIIPGKWGPEKLLKFYIKPPFYRTTWFYFFTAFLFVVTVLLYINQRIKTLRQKQEEQHQTRKKMIELQQQALASNLNPHFIFNALNSIQYFINYRNPDEANKYLSGFSRLMRMHLNFSDRTYIMLEEELFRLNDYLQLEQMRFEGKMKFEINVDSEIDPAALEIPNMVLQPFVENSIWHGIMSSDEPGEVIIKIWLMKNEVLEISIADNGVGMTASAQKIRKGHTSKGVAIIRQRLELMDPDARDIITFDSNPGSGPLPGTLVIIRLTTKMYRFKPMGLFTEN